MPRPLRSNDLSWTLTLKKWAKPFVPPPLRTLRISSLSVLFAALLTIFKALFFTIFFDIPRKTQIIATLWVFGWFCFTKYLEIGAIYFLVSVFVGMMYHLGEKEEGEMSAYSVFNRNFTRLVGTMTAEELIAQNFGGAAFAMLPRLDVAAAERTQREGEQQEEQEEQGERRGEQQREDGIEVVERVGRRRRNRDPVERNGEDDEEWRAQMNAGGGGGGGGEGARRRRRRK